MLTVFDIDGVEMQRNIKKKMLGMKNHFDISGSIEIREVDIARVACTWNLGKAKILITRAVRKLLRQTPFFQND